MDAEAIMQGFSLVFSVSSMMFMILGMFMGMLVGAIPGLTTSMAIAVLIPLTYSMAPVSALVFLCATYAGGTYGGSITAILINTPGTPNAAATTFDGHPMAMRGEPERALGLALGGSLIGGTFSYAFLLIAMMPIAHFAIKFGAPEMFLLAIMGLSIIAGIGKGNFAKAIFSGLFGILLANVGIAPTGAVRPHFGTPWLLTGMPHIPAIIGMLAYSELFRMVTASQRPAEKSSVQRARGLKPIIKGVLETFKYPRTVTISSIVGTLVGALPAAGGAIAAFLAYNQAKQTSKDPDSFGKGNPEGVIAPEVANNASIGGALTTSLAFGIPGSPQTAILLSALIMHGMMPGPRLFIDQMPLVYGLIIALFISNIAMLVIGLGFCKSLSGVVDVSPKIMAPIIAVFCMVGSFALRGSYFDVILMAIFAIIGFFMKKSHYSITAMILGIILGKLCDDNFIRTAIRYRHDFSVFVTRPLSLVIIVLTLLMMLYPVIRDMRDKKSHSA